MSQKKISYMNRTFDDYRSALKEFTKTYYPELASDMDDASIGSWLIDLFAAMGDNLSYYIDKAYNETNIDSAKLRKSVYALARNNGFKIPGPKGAVTQLKFTCTLPTASPGNSNSPSRLGMPSWTYAPVIKKGTRVTGPNGQYFELDEDVDFTENFDSNGEVNREWKPLVSVNEGITAYTVSKTGLATAGLTKTYSLVLSSSMVKPFMEVVLPDKNVMNVESIIIKDGANYQSDPCIEEFMLPIEHLVTKDDSGTDVYRFFEVECLADQYRWADSVSYRDAGDYIEAIPEIYQYSATTKEGDSVTVYSIAKGKWTPVRQKFITEYTDNGYLKVIFGGGSQIGQDVDYSSAGYNAQLQISRMINNNFLGVIPKPDMTMFIRYRVGGGQASNVAPDTIKNIVNLNAVNKQAPNAGDQRLASEILSSIKVTNIIPSVSGKDMPNVDELRYMIKYHNAAQERCITVKDYQDRVNLLPPRYGMPFRVSTIEENNKIMIYLLMLNYNRHLTDEIPSLLIKNMENYLSMFRSLNDYVEIKPGRVINVSFDVTVYVDRNYNAQNVIKNVIEKIRDYMDVKNHKLGEDIFIGDLQREIGNIDGVLNIFNMTVTNEFGDAYSSTKTSQPTMDMTDPENPGYDDETSNSAVIDLNASDYILNSEVDEMFEIKYPDKDIRVMAKQR